MTLKLWLIKPKKIWNLPRLKRKNRKRSWMRLPKKLRKTKHKRRKKQLTMMLRRRLRRLLQPKLTTKQSWSRLRHKRLLRKLYLLHKKLTNLPELKKRKPQSPTTRTKWVPNDPFSRTLSEMSGLPVQQACLSSNSPPLQFNKQRPSSLPASKRP